VPVHSVSYHKGIDHLKTVVSKYPYLKQEAAYVVSYSVSSWCKAYV